jgi:hypothetical protein
MTSRRILWHLENGHDPFGWLGCADDALKEVRDIRIIALTGEESAEPLSDFFQNCIIIELMSHSPHVGHRDLHEWIGHLISGGDLIVSSAGALNLLGDRARG